MTLILIAAAVAAGVTFFNEIIKQDAWSKQVNSALSLLTQALAAFGVAVSHAHGFHNVDWSDTLRALFGAGVGFAAIYQPVIKGLLGDTLQPATSVVTKPPPVRSTGGRVSAATPVSLPFQLPAGTDLLEFKAMYDADKDDEDIWARVRYPDGRQEIVHGWLRGGFGWVGSEPVFTAPAAATSAKKTPRRPARKD